MCIIIATYGADSAFVSSEVVNRCADNNPDGFGIMWPEAGRVKIWKTLTDVQGLYERYCELSAEGVPAVLHFRWATHGSKTIDNVHPFHVPNTSRKLAFAHNGVLDVPSSHEVSDTRMFGKHVLAHLPAGWRDNHELRACYEAGFLGTGNKVVTLDHDGRIDILNAQQGVWDEGVWYSNKGYQESRWAAWSSTARPSDIVAYRYGGWAFCLACSILYGDEGDASELYPLTAHEAAEFGECCQCEASFEAPTPAPAPTDLVGERVRRMSITPDNPIDRLPGEDLVDYARRRRDAYLDVAYDCEKLKDFVAIPSALSHFQGWAVTVLRASTTELNFDPFVAYDPKETVAQYCKRRLDVLHTRRAAAKPTNPDWQQCVHGVAVKEFCSTCNSTQYAPDVHGTGVPA